MHLGIQASRNTWECLESELGQIIDDLDRPSSWQHHLDSVDRLKALLDRCFVADGLDVLLMKRGGTQQ